MMKQKRCLEMEILEHLCTGTLAERDHPAWDELFHSPDFVWGDLIESAIRHKLLPMLAYDVLSRATLEDVPRFIGEFLREALRVNRHRLKVFRQVAAKLIAAFEGRGIRLACTKGLALESIVYQNRGLRAMWDVDFMIDPADRAAAARLLDELGFETGYCEWESGDLYHLSRRDLLAYKLNPDHLPHRVIRVDDDVLPYVSVDFACSFTWSRCEFSVPVAEALQKRSYLAVPGLDGRGLPVMPPEYHFIFIALHLFREAWVETWVSLEQDVNLIKFCDTLGFWNTHRPLLEHPSFQARIRELGVAKPMAWVLSHLDSVFATNLTDRAGLCAEVDQEWLRSAGGHPGKRRVWSGDMRERLRAKERGSLFQEVAD